MSRPPLGPRTWPSWLGAGALTLAWLLPARVRNPVAAFVARRYARRDTKHRRIAEVNVRACLPELDAEARTAFLERYVTRLVQSSLLTPRLWWGSADALRGATRWHGREHVDEALGAGRPVVLLISHTVALDVGMIAMSPDYPLQGFYKPFANPVVDYLVRRARTRFGGHPVARGNGFRAMIRGLEHGALLCYLSDEDLGREGSVFAPFFGCTKATLAMLPRIVRRTDAVVVPMATLYDPDTDRFDVHFLAPLEGYPSDDEIDNATRMNEAIEATVRLAPEQYLWKLRLFTTCPEGGRGRYRRIERGELSPCEL